MKKMILSLAIGVLSISAFQAFATDGETGATTRQPEPGRQQQCGQRPDSCGAPRQMPPMGECGQMPAPRKCPFEDIQLSDSQKEEMKTLHETLMTSMRDAKGDSTKTADAKAAFLAGVKKSLGDKKYVQFLENSFSVEPQMCPGERRGEGGPRGERQAPKAGKKQHKQPKQEAATTSETK